MQFYNGLSLEDVWAGRVPVSRILVLVEHLLLAPESRCRAIRYGEDLRWVGWTHTAEATASLFDLVAQIAAGDKFTDKDRYPRPNTGDSRAQREEHERTELYAPTIADFNTGRFMREVAA